MSGAWRGEAAFRQRQSEAMRARWRDPEYRAARSEESRKRWLDPEFARKLSEARKAAWRDPEMRRRYSEALTSMLKKMWSDPDFVARFRAMRSAYNLSRNGRCPALCADGEHQCIGSATRAHEAHEFIATCHAAGASV
jgi:hypothetical protein